MPPAFLVTRRSRRAFTFVLASAAFLAIATSALADKAPFELSTNVSRDGAWTSIPAVTPPLPATPPPARMAYGAAWDTQRNRMIVFGGHPTFRNDTWVLAAGAWQQLVTAGTPPSPRYGHSCVYDSVNDRLIVFGGISGSDNLNDVWSLTLTGTPTWAPLATFGTPPSARLYSVVTYDSANQRMVVFAGHDGAFRNDTWTLTLGATPTWSSASAGTPPPARDLSHGIYDASRQRMVLYGGWSGSDFLNDTWQLSLAGTPTWSPFATTGAPSKRREHSASYDPVRDRMIIAGGLDVGYPTPLNEVWALSFATDQWQQLPSLPDNRRTAHESVYDPLLDRLIVHGGYSGTNYLSTTMALNLSGTPEWVDLFPAFFGSPSARREYSMVFDPLREQMVLFSGTQASPPLDRGVWTFDLSDPDAAWQRHLIANGPNPRHGHVAVWDAPRDRMLMFGGYDDQSLAYLNELWELKWTPSPTWTLLTPGGTLPSPRMALGMIHDPVRDRLVIMGGHPQYLNEVWALPLSGANAMQWSQLSPAGTPPAPRWGHSFVYDSHRDQAIMFAGTSEGGVVHDDVWALDLTGGTSWAELDPNGPMPLKRLVHTAIYDPSLERMLVYGGGNYDPVFLLDTWELRLSEQHPRWKRMHPLGPNPGERDLVTAVYDAPRTRLAFFGGFREDPTTFHADTWFLNWGSDEPDSIGGMAQLSGNQIVVTWNAPGIDAATTKVYRREANDPWVPVGAPGASPSNRLVFAESAAEFTGEWAYRLGIRLDEGEGYAGEAVIQLPVGVDASPHGTFELAPSRPNPSLGDIAAVFSLPDRSAAQLALVDLAGRVIESREVGSLGAGTHRIELARGRTLPVGMYFIRLDSGGRSLRTKVAIIR